jgi:hypothetical protein
VQASARDDDDKGSSEDVPFSKTMVAFWVPSAPGVRVMDEILTIPSKRKDRQHTDQTKERRRLRNRSESRRSLDEPSSRGRDSLATKLSKPTVRESDPLLKAAFKGLGAEIKQGKGLPSAERKELVELGLGRLGRDAGDVDGVRGRHAGEWIEDLGKDGSRRGRCCEEGRGSADGSIKACGLFPIDWTSSFLHPLYGFA